VVLGWKRECVGQSGAARLEGVKGLLYGKLFFNGVLNIRKCVRHENKNKDLKEISACLS